jgi:outer membrane protein insertion porin family
LIALTISLSFSLLALQSPVTEVEVRGNRLVPASSIEFYLGLPGGLSSTELSPAFRRLWSTGLFEDVRFDTEPADNGHGLKLTVQVREKPLLRETRISGEAGRAPEAEVREGLRQSGISLARDRPFGDDDARNVARVVEKLLRGELEVSTRLEPAGGDGDAHVDLVIELTRKEWKRIENIRLDGNHALESAELHDVMRLRPSDLVSRLTHRDRYDPETLASDAERVRALYRSRGFASASVGPPVVRQSGENRVSIEIPIVEGDRYRFGKLVVEPGSLFSQEDADSLLPRSGGFYDASALDRVVETLTNHYLARGYPLARVDREETTLSGALAVDVTLRVVEGPFRRVGLVSFHGNRRHRDPDLRQLLDLVETERFDPREVDRAAATLMATGDFVAVSPQVDMDARPGRADVDLHLQEKKVFEYLLGGGLTGTQGGTGSGELIARGLLGRSETMRIDLDLGDRFQNVAAGYRDTSTLGHRLYLAGDFRKSHIQFPDETAEDTTDFAVRAGGPSGSKWQFLASTRFSSFTLDSTLQGEVPFLTPFLGMRFHTYRAGLAVAHEARDRASLATSGHRLSAAYEVAFGDVELQRLRLEASLVRSLDAARHHQVALSGSAEAIRAFGATVDTGVPRFERLFLGSENDLRGFPIRGVGPREGPNVVGGDRLVFGSAEYHFAPVDRFRLVGFFDFGNVFATDFDGDPLPHLRYDAGSELQILVPVANVPVRIGYGWNLNRILDEPRGRFFVALSLRF